MTQDRLATPIDRFAFKEPVFTGNPHAHTDRTNFIQLLNTILPMRTFITQSPGDLREFTPELSMSAYAILGLCTGYDIDHYIDVRPFQYMGAGAVMITRRFKGMDDIIPPDLYFPFHGYTASDAASVKYIYDQYCYKKDK